jgi:hypothetical protein
MLSSEGEGLRLHEEVTHRVFRNVRGKFYFFGLICEAVVGFLVVFGLEESALLFRTESVLAVTWIAVVSVLELGVMLAMVKPVVMYAICVRGFLCDMWFRSGHAADSRKRTERTGRSRIIRVFWNAVLVFD